MTDSAINVSKDESTTREPRNVIERLEQYSQDHPEATTYQVTTELEAEELLGAMAVSLSSLANEVKDERDRGELLKYGKLYHQAVVQHRALDYNRGLTAEDELVIYGLKLQVPAIVLQ
jgi:hypothetical protein